MKPNLERLRPFCLHLIAILLAFQADAAPVTIDDPSFENNALNAGNWTNSIGPEWTGSNGQNDGGAFEEYITGFSADGTDHLGMELNYDVWQDLGVTYQPNTRYTLTIAAGNRGGNSQSGNQTEYLLADSTGTVYATGSYDAFAGLPTDSFGDAPPLVFDTQSNPSCLGQTVRVLLRARGEGRSHFDHIRLDATEIVTGAAAIVNQPASSVTSSEATLNGEITSIGNEAPEVTIYWGGGDGGFNPASWEHNVTLAGTQTGAFSTSVSGLSPNTTYFYRCKATNSGGDSWAASSSAFETLALPPTVENGTAGDIESTSATLGANVTFTGGDNPEVTIYYGTTDGGTNVGLWDSSMALGKGSGVLSTSVSGLSPSTTYYFRAYASNAGGQSWAPDSAVFNTSSVTLPTVEIRDTDGITGTTASLHGKVTDTGTSPPEVTLYYGVTDGDTNPAGWEHGVSLGLQNDDFSHFVSGLSPDTPYYFRYLATNAAGSAWSSESGTFSTTGLVPSTAVINEFHYNPLDNTSLEEFVELHNPGDAAIDLSGWTLSDAVTFTFPGGTILPVGGYLVVAENPAVLEAKYSISGVLGPWTGKLSSKGERIDLRDAGGTLKDRVEYDAGFPWPTAADGDGPSVELIDPSLDNDLGGSWRSSYNPGNPSTTFIAAASTGWKYKKGTAEASSPIEAWRSVAFDDSSWLTGQASIGYADNDDHTIISDMRYNYWSIYFRKTFTVPSNQIPDTLTLKLWIDDGCVVWINGTEVARNHVNAGELYYNSHANDHEASSWETFTLTNASEYLIGGTNVIAVHGLNSSLNSSDFSMDVELSSGGSAASSNPTPGRANGSILPTHLIPPQIRQVSHSPKQPAADVPVTITAKITDPDGMGAVSLLYQTVDPGSYIRMTDAAYATNWTAVPMTDDGTNGDQAAGDSVFTAVIPQAVQTNRRLVRYRISFADSLGNSLTVPYSDDQQPNFAYYVYSGLPAWQGAFRPGTTPLQTFPPSLLDDIPVYTLVANGTDVINSQYNSGYDAVRFHGTFVANGEVYDHIEFKNRGEASTYQSGKNKWRFFFNRARDLPAEDNFGNKFGETWDSFSGDACASPWAPLNRGMAGVEEAVSYKVFQLAGIPSPSTHYYHFRVVRNATETPPAGTTVSDPIGNADGQYAGDFWGLYLAVENPDGSFLDERNLPDGNVYKIEGNTGDKKHQAYGQPVDSSDWNTFRDAHVSASPTESWWRANMDMDAYYTYHALNRLIGDVDVRGGYNHYFYHRSSDNRWVPIPWDLDMMYIAKNHWTTSINGTSYPGVIHAHRSVLEKSAIAREYRNRAREIVSLMASDGTAGGGQIGQLIDEFAQIVNPTGLDPTWADADAAMWNLHPRTTGSDSVPSGQGNHKGNFYRTSFNDSRIGGSWVRWLRSPGSSGTMEFEDTMNYLRDYTTNTWPGGAWAANNGNQLGYGYQYLVAEAADATVPAKPSITSTGASGFPNNDLSFTCSAFSDPQGAGTQAATQWRLAEISGPGIAGWTSGTPRKYEINAVWESGTGSTADAITIPVGLAEAGKTYRVRVRHQDTTGNWSYWSEPVQFTATTPQLDLVHYWNFNDTDALLVPTLTHGGGTITPDLAGASALLSGTGQNFSALNARNDDPAGSHLRLNNPLGSTLDFALPTSGFENILVQYETRRSGQGAGLQEISYTTDGTNFSPFSTHTVLDDDPELVILDFRSVPESNNNPHFAIRISFTQGDGGTAGNNRFDNLTVEGDALPSGYDTWKLGWFTNPSDLADPDISGPHGNPSGDGVENLIRYALGVGPYDPVLDLLPVLASEGGYVFKFRYDATKTDLIWRVRATNDLTDWSHVVFDSSSSPIPPLEDGWLPVALPAHLEGGPSPDPSMFARLEVELAAP